MLKLSASAGSVPLFELPLSLDAESQVLEKHKEEFFEIVDAKCNLARLVRRGVISYNLLLRIESTDSENAKELLYHHLYHNADVSLREYCKMVMATVAVPEDMQELAKKLLQELPDY